MTIRPLLVACFVLACGAAQAQTPLALDPNVAATIERQVQAGPFPSLVIGLREGGAARVFGFAGPGDGAYDYSNLGMGLLGDLLAEREHTSYGALAQAPQRAAGQPGTRIGLAWHLSRRKDTTLIWHNGMTGGYASYIGYTDDGRRGVVVLANAARPVDAIALAVLFPELAAAALAQFAGR